MAAKIKMLKEEFAKFFEEPTRPGLRDLLKNNLGEFPNLDFKKEWLPFPQLAKHIIGIANAGGGCIIIGMAENDDKSFDPMGLEKIIDKADITNGINKYIQQALRDGVQILDFAFEESEYPKIKNKKFQCILIGSDSKHLPYLSEADGEKIEKDTIYIRRGTNTERANYPELQSLINKRLETGYSSQSEIDLRTNLEHLQILYAQINKVNYVQTNSIRKLILSFSSMIEGMKEEVPNSSYPEEGFDEFIASMIEKKKVKIKILLGVIEI